MASFVDKEKDMIFHVNDGEDDGGIKEVKAEQIGHPAQNM